jgi:hypothetical protein
VTAGPPERRGDDVPPPAKTPDYEYGEVKVNWVALAVIAVVLIVLALISWVAALIGGLLIAMILVVNQSGTGNWVQGGIGDDAKAAQPKRDRRPRDY